MTDKWRRLGDIPRGWYFRLNADDPRWRLLNTEATWLWDKDAKVLCRPPSGHVADDELVTITVSRSTLDAAVNCVQAAANDPTEPERYRKWYSEALAELDQTRISPPPG